MFIKTGQVYNITKDNEPIANATVTSTVFDLGSYRDIRYSMGRKTSIIPERRHQLGLILVDSGRLTVIAGDGEKIKEITLTPADIFARPAQQLIGFRAEEDCVFSEMDFPISCHINEKLFEEKGFPLPDFVSYDSGQVEHVTIAESGMSRLQIAAYPQDADFPLGNWTHGNIHVYEGQVTVKMRDRTMVMNPGDNLTLNREDLVERHIRAHTKLAALMRID